MHAGSYGLTPADGQAQPGGPAGSRAAGAWHGRSGRAWSPPLAEGFIARPETVPGLEAALVPGAAVALVPGQDAGRAPDWPGSSGKTQLAAWLAGSLWQSRDGRPAGLGDGQQPGLDPVRLPPGRRGAGPGSRSDAEAVAARFAAWLNGTGRPWLVVLDDLRDAADLDGLWPAGPGGC